MTWQIVTLTVLATLAMALGAPQLLYHQLLPPQLPASTSLLLSPPGVAHLASLQQYAAAVNPVSGQYVILTRQEKPDAEKPEKPEKPDEQGWLEWVGSYFPHIPVVNPAPEKPEAAVPDKPNDASKPAEGSPAKLEELDEGAAPVPAVRPDQKYILGQPQFFGNFDGLKKLGVQNLHNKGAIPNFLLVRGGGGVHHLGGKPEPEKLQAPGQAALAFQQSLRNHQGAVLAALRAKADDIDGEGEDAEDVEANQPGPSVAQVKPQAIALAGPGGVAAAAPMGTALVGPGGLAVAAPSATAVAGPSGGAPPVVAPAHKLTTQYLEAQSLGRPGVIYFRP